MNLDNPDRFDLIDEGPFFDGSPRPPEMQRRANGDWVRHEDYSGLLEAHDDLQKRLNEIAEIAQ